MRIAQIAPPWFPVPPHRYGGTERVVAHLADGLAARGHDVTLYACGGSRTEARLRSPMPVPPAPLQWGNAWDEAYHAFNAYLHRDEFDVIHDHSGIFGPSLGALLCTNQPVVHTLHGTWTAAARRHYPLLHDRVHLVAISRAQKVSNPQLHYAAVIHHGLAADDFPFCQKKEDFLVFLGRANPDKGIVEAIEIARAVDLPLVIMVKVSEPTEVAYWRDEVEPRLGADITVIRNADHFTKVDHLSRARAMVFPMNWNEPFGLVMIEALACGTPVIVTRRGSAPEIVDHGRTGFLVDPSDPVPASIRALQHLDALDPRTCREQFEARFSAERMVIEYERLFEGLVNKARGRRDAARNLMPDRPRRGALEIALADGVTIRPPM